MFYSKSKFKIAAYLFIIISICTLSEYGYGGKVVFNKKLNNGWHLKTEKLQIKISSIDNKIFQIKAVPIGTDWKDNFNTFIDPDFKNKKKQYSPDKVEEKGIFGIKTGNRIINILKKSCEIYLLNQDGNKIIKNMKLAFHPGLKPFWEVSFTCSLKERNYGIGNPEMGKSGGLLKSYAVTTVGNGIAQIPFFWSTVGYGILINYDKKGMIKRKKGNKHYLIIPGRQLDFYLLSGDTPFQILKKYTDLTGAPPIPPLWTFGFMISRWGYKDWKDVSTINTDALDINSSPPWITLSSNPCTSILTRRLSSMSSSWAVSSRHRISTSSILASLVYGNVSLCNSSIGKRDELGEKSLWCIWILPLLSPKANGNARKLETCLILFNSTS